MLLAFLQSPIWEPVTKQFCSHTFMTSDRGKSNGLEGYADEEQGPRTLQHLTAECRAVKMQEHSPDLMTSCLETRLKYTGLISQPVAV